MIATTQDLCDYLDRNYSIKLGDHRTTLDAAAWFCCIQEAISASQLDTKELATMFLNGVVGYNNSRTEAVQNWIDLYHAYCAESVAYGEEYETLEQVLEQFYNPQK